MQKKWLIIVFLLLVGVGVFIYPRVFGASSAVPLSNVSANPSKYLGDLAISGVTGPVFPEDGGFILLDEKGCCQLNILVPFTKEQQALLEADFLYAGRLPVQGDPVTVKGTLKREGAYYLLDVERVISGEEVIISKQ